MTDDFSSETREARKQWEHSKCSRLGNPVSSKMKH